MDRMWYYARNGAQTGPLSFDALKAAAAAGQLAPTDLVWQEGTADWVKARTVPGLFVGPPPVPKPGPEPLPLDDAPSPWAEFAATAAEFARRAFTPSPAAVRLLPAEEERLTAAGVTDPTARTYAAWRRAVLWVAAVPTGLSAVLGLADEFAKGGEADYRNSFGVLLDYVQALALFALPAAAVLAALAYDRLRESARRVALGAAVAVGVPVAVAFVPSNLVLNDKADAPTQMMLRFFSAVGYYLTLTPTVFSLLPAATRGCVRVKAFLPQSLVPGWGLVASVPLFVLLTLATFVFLYRFVGNVVLMAGLVLWVGGPLLYLLRFRLLTRPLTDPREVRQLAATRRLAAWANAAGILLVVVYLFTGRFGEVTILGFSDRDSLLRPWNLDLHAIWIELAGRSLFLTVLFADLLVRMALSVWREERAFAGTPGAAAFDATMTGLAGSVEGVGGRPAD
ncbi:MAG: hypothetical protein C0501_20435 [Isosphaera sp.]|nr:hypothetical protein [Isosphaera sp.]